MNKGIMLKKINKYKAEDFIKHLKSDQNLFLQDRKKDVISVQSVEGKIVGLVILKTKIMYGIDVTTAINADERTVDLLILLTQTMNTL